MSLEIYTRVNNILTSLAGRENDKIESHDIRELFQSHNQAFPNKPEYSQHCGGCRQRVYNRLISWRDENRSIYEK
jgi:hypothetical protein